MKTSGQVSCYNFGRGCGKTLTLLRQVAKDLEDKGSVVVYQGEHKYLLQVIGGNLMVYDWPCPMEQLQESKILPIAYEYHWDRRPLTHIK